MANAKAARVQPPVQQPTFDAKGFLESIGAARRVASYAKGGHGPIDSHRNGNRDGGDDVLIIDKAIMLRLLRDEPTFSERFIS